MAASHKTTLKPQTKPHQHPHETFENKVVLIIGATSSIGKASALAFGKAGAKVIGSGRRESEGQAVVAEIVAAGGEATFIQVDVTQESQVQALVEKTVATYGRLDVAFNKAGVEVMGPMTDATESDFRKAFDTNVWGVIASMKDEIPAMLKTGGGSIINTSSIAGQIGLAGAGIYVATKHAVEGLTKSAALEVAKLGIRINAVAPAAIETEMFTRFTGGNEDAINYMRGMHPIGRSGQPREIADPVLFLASDAASFIIGTSLAVDGGWMAQ